MWDERRKGSSIKWAEERKGKGKGKIVAFVEDNRRVRSKVGSWGDAESGWDEGRGMELLEDCDIVGEIGRTLVSEARDLHLPPTPTAPQKRVNARLSSPEPDDQITTDADESPSKKRKTYHSVAEEKRSRSLTVTTLEQGNIDLDLPKQRTPTNITAEIPDTCAFASPPRPPESPPRRRSARLASRNKSKTVSIERNRDPSPQGDIKSDSGEVAVPVETDTIAALEEEPIFAWPSGLSGSDSD